jgi:hypothetical protein
MAREIDRATSERTVPTMLLLLLMVLLEWKSGRQFVMFGLGDEYMKSNKNE